MEGSLVLLGLPIPQPKARKVRFEKEVEIFVLPGENGNNNGHAARQTKNKRDVHIARNTKKSKITKT